MTHRFLLSLALTLAVGLVASQTSLQAQSRTRPYNQLPIPGSPGGLPGNVQILIIVVVTTPDGTEQQYQFKGANALSKARAFAANQKAKGNSVRFVPR